ESRAREYALPKYGPRAPSRRNWLDVGSARLAEHSDEYGGEVPFVEARFRNAGLHARAAQDGFAERALACRDPTPWSARRRHLSKPHDYSQRAHPAYRLFQHH